MGPVLKILVGVYLFIWSVIGILIIVGAFVFAQKLPDLKTSASGLSQLFQNMPGEQNQDGQQVSGGVNQDVEACLKKILGDEFTKPKSPTSEPSQAEREAFQKCGGQQTNNQTNQQYPSGSGTPPNTQPSGSYQPTR